MYRGNFTACVPTTSSIAQALSATISARRRVYSADAGPDQPAIRGEGQQAERPACLLLDVVDHRQRPDVLPRERPVQRAGGHRRLRSDCLHKRRGVKQRVGVREGEGQPRSGEREREVTPPAVVEVGGEERRDQQRTAGFAAYRSRCTPASRLSAAGRCRRSGQATWRASRTASAMCNDASAPVAGSARRPHPAPGRPVPPPRRKPREQGHCRQRERTDECRRRPTRERQAVGCHFTSPPSITLRRRGLKWQVSIG